MMHILEKSFWTKKKLEYIGAMVIGVFATMYVLCSSTDSAMTQQITQDYIERANVYGFFQAKRIREEVIQLFYANIQDSEFIQASLTAEAIKLLEHQAQKLAQKIKEFQDKTNPEGAEMLLKKAKVIEDEINQLNNQDGYLGNANNFYQIAIILASIALVISSPAILILSILVGSVGFSLHMYGLFGAL